MLTELYRSTKGVSFQCEVTNKLLVKFKNQELLFSISDFLVFRRKLKEVDVQSMIFNLSDEYDFVSLQHHKSRILFRLTLCDFIQLRELIDGTQFSLELISMIHEVLGDYSVA